HMRIIRKRLRDAFRVGPGDLRHGFSPCARLRGGRDMASPMGRSASTISRGGPTTRGRAALQCEQAQIVCPSGCVRGSLHDQGARSACLPVILLSFPVSDAMADNIPRNVITELAPGGKLRAAINFGNSVLAQKDPATGEPRGVSSELARELAKRLAVPIEFVTFDAAGKVF